MTTSLTIITDAYQELGVLGEDETLATTDAKYIKGLRRLNQMLKALSVNGVTVPAMVREEIALGASAVSYTIGSGATLNTTRPVSLVSAQFKSGDGVYFPLDIITDEGRYGRMAIKNTAGIPTAVYYHNTYPNGKLYFDYAPPATGTLALASWKPFTEFADETSTWDGAPEYELFLTLKLAVFLGPIARAASEDIARCDALLSEVEAAIARQNGLARVPTLDLSGALPGGRRYDILRDA